MDFSVCVIAKNEEKTLPSLVDSLSDFKGRGGELLLLDTGSDDNTIEVARDLGFHVVSVGDKFVETISKSKAKAINDKFLEDDIDRKIVNPGDKIFDYSAARNFIAKKASNDMVAMPDCDEEYTTLNLDKIQELLEKGIEQLKYPFVFAHDEDGNPLKQFYHSKFYDRTKLKWEGIIHEVLQPKDGVEKIDRKVINEDIIKLEHWKNQDSDRSHYLTGLALDVYENPDNDRNRHYFARELKYKGFMESSLKQFKVHVDMDNAWQTEQSQSHIYIGDIYKQFGSKKAAKISYQDAIDLEGERREPYMKMAEMYRDEENWRQCIAFAKAALTVPADSGGFYSNYQPYYEETPHQILYVAYWRTGEKEKAQKHFDIAKNMKPEKESIKNDAKWFND